MNTKNFKHYNVKCSGMYFCI